MVTNMNALVVDVKFTVWHLSLNFRLPAFDELAVVNH